MGYDGTQKLNFKNLNGIQTPVKAILTVESVAPVCVPFMGLRQ